MTVKELSAALSLTEFSLPAPEAEVTGGYAGDLLSWVMGRARAGDCWITIMSNQNVAAVAVMADVACILLSEGVKPDEALLTKARQQGINLLGSGKGTFELAHDVGEKMKSQESRAGRRRPGVFGGCSVAGSGLFSFSVCPSLRNAGVFF